MGGSGEGFVNGQKSALPLFGQYLRRLRLETGLTQEECAARLGYSAQHLGNMETGRRMPQESFAAAADQLLGGRQVLFGLWRLARDQAAGGCHGGLRDPEAGARAIHTYQAHLVPGLLQHPSYAAAVMASSRPPLSPAEADARVTFHMSRQEILLRDDPPWLWAVVDEAVLRRELGGRAVMRAQLALLAERAAQHTITLQVLPFAAPTSPAMGVSFTLLSFADGVDIGYAGTLSGGQVRRDAQAARGFRAAFDYLREAALSAADSLALIDRRRRELARGAA